MGDRWNKSRKAKIVERIRRGELTVTDAVRVVGSSSEEEILEWMKHYDEGKFVRKKPKPQKAAMPSITMRSFAYD